MNEDDQISASVVNDPQQPSGISACQRRNLIQLLRKTGPLPNSMPTPLQVDTDETGQQQLLNFSFERDTNRNAGKEVPTKTMCNMCCRKDVICVNLQHNHATVLTVSDITRLPSWDIRQILAAVCSRCLVYIGAITESSSKLRLRCEQAMHSQTVAVVAPPTPDTSPNNFLQVAPALLDDAPDHSIDVQQQRNCYAPGYCVDTANDISLPIVTSSPPAPAPLSNEIFAAISRSPTPSIPGNDSMLRIHYERAVSPLNTESGGGGKYNKRNYQRVQNIPVQMICEHCNRAYWRKDYYQKHMRRCRAKFRYAKSLMSTRLRSASRMELDAISVVSEGNEQITTNNQPRTYRCQTCNVTVENISKLRQHKRIHLPRFYCDICSGEYTSQNEYDFHRAQCIAKKEVFDKGLQNIRNNIKSPVTIPAKRITRSFSRAQSVAHSLAPSLSPSKPETVKKVKTPAKKSKTPKKKEKVPEKDENEKIKINQEKLSEQTQNDDVQSTITNYVRKHKHLYTDMACEVSNSDIFEKHSDINESKSGVGAAEEDDEDVVSQVDTLYSKRLSLTNHWVETHSVSSQSHLSQSDNYIEDYMKDIPFRSLKEYDLYLLDRLKIEVRLNSLTCFVSDCKFTCATLNEMMVHDYICHYKSLCFIATSVVIVLPAKYF